MQGAQPLARRYSHSEDFLLKGFKDFIMRGNVIDLAVGVAIAGAFTALIDAFTKNIINPLIAAAGGTSAANGLGFNLKGSEGPASTFVNFGNLITALITFLITAAVIYFVLVVPMNRFNEMRRIRAGLPAKEEEPVDEATLLTEIRDALVSRK